MRSEQHGGPGISASCVAKMLHYILHISCVCLARGSNGNQGNSA